MKLELLVIAGQTYRGEYVLKSCTHRPSSQGSWEYPKRHFCGTKVSSMTKTKSSEQSALVATPSGNTGEKNWLYAGIPVYLELLI